MAIVVKPSEIQSTLSKIWDSLESSGKMRASLFNLIFYADEGPRGEYTQKIAQHVIEQFPARIIMIRGSKSEGLVTKVSLLSPRGKEMDVACDLIEINVSSIERIRVPFLILPHILPDLPIYLIWGKDPTVEDSLFSELKKLATRIIFDSECTESLTLFAKAVLENHSAHTEIADLNWARCESWRNILSSAFYSQKRLQHLKEAKKIEIRFNAASTTSFSHTQIQALYLQSWLTAQLGWNKEKPEFRLLPDAQKERPPGLILQVDIFTKDEGHYNFTLDSTPPQKITMTFSSHELCELPSQFLLPRKERGQSLVKEICHPGTSSHYLKVLELLESPCE
ncbi:MAG: glucose-6-phosphate dehydrogenase assembly protein OpcA [Chlamydiales bacterium]